MARIPWAGLFSHATASSFYVMNLTDLKQKKEEGLGRAILASLSGWAGEKQAGWKGRKREGLHGRRMTGRRRRQAGTALLLTSHLSSDIFVLRACFPGTSARLVFLEKTGLNNILHSSSAQLSGPFLTSL